MNWDRILSIAIVFGVAAFIVDYAVVAATGELFRTARVLGIPFIWTPGMLVVGVGLGIWYVPELIRGEMDEGEDDVDE